MTYSPVLNPHPVTISGTAAVSGTFWQTTQPVSGTFWQTTQPVSIASMPSTPVTGTFWQATQPVSGTFWQATQPVSFTQPALVAGTALIGKVGIDQTTPGTTNAVSITNASIAVTGTFFQATQPVSGTVTVTPPTLTKGTQAATGFSVQELKDGGRSCLAMTAEFAFAQTAETLLTMTFSADGAATSTFSSRVITSGKKFRIQSIDMEVETLGSGTAPQRAYLRLRRNTAGATIASSSLQAVWSCANNTAIVKSAAVTHFEIPDAIEMNGDGTATFGFTLETPDFVTTTATGRAKITAIGMEF